MPESFAFVGTLAPSASRSGAAFLLVRQRRWVALGMGAEEVALLPLLPRQTSVTERIRRRVRGTERPSIRNSPRVWCGAILRSRWPKSQPPRSAPGSDRKVFPGRQVFEGAGGFWSGGRARWDRVQHAVTSSCSLSRSSDPGPAILVAWLRRTFCPGSFCPDPIHPGSPLDPGQQRIVRLGPRNGDLCRPGPVGLGPDGGRDPAAPLASQR